MAKSNKSKLPVVTVVMLVLNIIATVLLLLSYLAPYLDARDYGLIADIGFGYLILLIVNILFIIFWLITKAYRFAFISIVGVLLGFNVLPLYFGFSFSSQPDKKENDQAIRIMQYNVHGFLDVNDNGYILNDVNAIITAKQPDVVCMEEYNTPVGAKTPVAAAIKSALKANYSFFKMAVITQKDSIGNAIFSKYPIVDTGSVAGPPSLRMRAAYVDIKKNNKIFRVYAIHLASVTIKEGNKSEYLNGDVSLRSSSFIESKLNAAFYRRSLQVAKIRRHMDDCKYPYILTGDFNDSPISYAVNTLADGNSNAFAEKGRGFVNTYYSAFPLQIDYVLASPQFEVLSYQAIDKKLSDHKPVVVDLKLN